MTSKKKTIDRVKVFGSTTTSTSAYDLEKEINAWFENNPEAQIIHVCMFENVNTTYVYYRKPA